jgi:hypothetical protein
MQVRSHPKDGASKFHRNVGVYLPQCMAPRSGNDEMMKQLHMFLNHACFHSCFMTHFLDGSSGIQNIPVGIISKPRENTDLTSHKIDQGMEANAVVLVFDTIHLQIKAYGS